MQAWILDESPGSYRWGTLPDPDVGPDDVRVKVKASALNHLDLWLQRGLPKPRMPHVPGCDVAGVVEAVGPQVVGVAVGDEVVVNPSVSPLHEIVELGNDSPLGRGFQIVGEHRWGGHADLVVVPARNVVPKPAARTWEECAAYPIASLTAWRMLRRSRLTAGETLLIVGVGGGVASAAMALGLQMGAEVYVTSTSEIKRKQAIHAGAHGAFASDEPWPVRAHVVIETVGPATWERSVRALRPGGRLVVAGGTSGQDVTISLPKLFFKQHEIIGSTMGSYEEFAHVTALVGQGLPIFVDRTFALDEYLGALDHLKAGAHFGNVVLTHGDSVHSGAPR